MPLSTNEYQKQFSTSDLGAQVRAQLESMVTDATYHTNSSYSSVDGDNGAVTFVEKHFVYLSTHPKSKPHEYLANLRLKTRVSNIMR